MGIDMHENQHTSFSHRENPLPTPQVVLFTGGRV